MEDVVKEYTRQLGDSGLISAPLTFTETPKFSSNAAKPLEDATTATIQSSGFDVLGGPDRGAFDVLGTPDTGSLDVFGRADLGGFDVFGTTVRGSFDVLGGPDTGSLDVMGNNR